MVVAGAMAEAVVEAGIVVEEGMVVEAVAKVLPFSFLFLQTPD